MGQARPELSNPCLHDNSNPPLPDSLVYGPWFRRFIHFHPLASLKVKLGVGYSVIRIILFSPFVFFLNSSGSKFTSGGANRALRLIPPFLSLYSIDPADYLRYWSVTTSAISLFQPACIPSWDGSGLLYNPPRPQALSVSSLSRCIFPSPPPSAAYNGSTLDRNGAGQRLTNSHNLPGSCKSSRLCVWHRDSSTSHSWRGQTVGTNFSCLALAELLCALCSSARVRKMKMSPLDFAFWGAAGPSIPTPAWYSLPLVDHYLMVPISLR